MTTVAPDLARRALMRHASRRGAVQLDSGAIGTLTYCPPADRGRCTVVTPSDRHLHPWPHEVTAILCGICGLPADARIVARGLRLCDQCARDEQPDPMEDHHT